MGDSHKDLSMLRYLQLVRDGWVKRERKVNPFTMGLLLCLDAQGMRP